MPVHIEYGQHGSAKDAELRLKKHLEGPSRVQHIVFERFKAPPEFRGLFGVQESRAYIDARKRLVEEANRKGPEIQVTPEPMPTEKALRHFRAWRDSEGLTRAALKAGDLDTALKTFTRATIQHAKVHAERERGIATLLTALHAAGAEDRMLLEIGSAHSHLGELLRRRGIRISGESGTAGSPALETDIVMGMVQAHHEMREAPGRDELRLMMRKGLLSRILPREILFKGAVYDTAVRNLTSEETTELYNELKTTRGKDMGVRAHQWMAERGKFDFATPKRPKEQPGFISRLTGWLRGKR